MKIYCINLNRSIDRKNFQIAQAKRLGLEIEFIQAVDFKTLDENTLIEAAQHWTRPIVGKDVGCFHSHQKAWEKVAENFEPALIIEDDIVFSNSLPEVLSVLSKQPFPLNRVYDLEYAPRKHVINRTPLWEKEEIVATRMWINKNGAGSYVLTPEVAKRLRRESEHYVMVDSWLWTRPWIDQVQIEPCPCSQLRDIEDTLDQPTCIAMSTGELKEYQQFSWLRKKTTRLKLTVDQIPSFSKALISGESRMLNINLNTFKI